MRWTPRGYGGERRPPEKVKRDGWREQGLLAVSVDDNASPGPSASSSASSARSSTAASKNSGRQSVDNWTVEMVEERLVEAAAGDAASAAGACPGLLQHMAQDGR